MSDSEPDPRKNQELASNLIAKSLDRSTSQIVAFNQISAVFANTAIRSSFLLNGMALFALPPILIAFSGEHTSSLAGKFFYPALCYIFGIILAAGSCLTAYYNYQVAARRAEHQHSVEYVLVHEKHDLPNYFRNQDYFERVKSSNRPSVVEASYKMTATARIGVVLAGFSFGFFALGCCFAGQVLVGM